MKILFYLLLFVSITQGFEKNPIIKIKHGKIKGITQQTETGKLYHTFKEIPYAKPPVGNLRFAEPTFPDPWNETRDATKSTKICLQLKTGKIDDIENMDNEDCLYLIVYTPVVSPTSELLPVYVFIHGGMFLYGNPHFFNFDSFINEDIIVVVPTYRLSALGFLSTSDGVIPGNLGLKDQIHSFKWVKENIKYFGGDPNKVTIGGHSAGAISIGFHVLNPKLKGLFRAAVIQSGGALLPTLNFNASHTAYTWAEQFDPKIRSKNTHELLSYLRTLPAELLISTGFREIPPYLQSILLGTSQPWFPTVEDGSFENTAISGPLHDNAENGISNHIPILTGLTLQENMDFDVPKLFKKMELDVTKIFDITVNIKPENLKKAYLELKTIYTQTENILDNVTAIFEAHNDLLFNIPIMNFAHLHSKYANVYFYQFSYKGVINGKGKWFGGPYLNEKAANQTVHCSELPFLYKFKVDPSLTPSEEDLAQRKKLVKIWTNFIKYLTPTPQPDPLLQNIVWPTVTINDFKYVDLNRNLTIQTNPKSFKAWHTKVAKYLEHPQYVY